MICDNVLQYGYTIPLLYAGIIKYEELQGCMGPDVHTGLPLALGKHPRGVGVNPPFAVFCCTSCLCRPNIHIRSPVPVFLSCIPAITSESMGTCFTEGGVCDMQGNLGDPRPFTARKYFTLIISTLDSTAWSTQVSEYPQGVLEYSEYS